MEQFLNWLMNAIEVIGYPGIFLCMAIESTFIPLPSEVIIPPAGYLASQGKMNIYLVILAGTIGSVVGALFNYWISLKLGRTLVLKWGKYFLLTEHRFEKAERFFNEHGSISTFAGRLVLGVRHYISIPAGLTKMNLKKFILYTFLGAAIWNIVLAYVGFAVGKTMDLKIIKAKSHEMSVYVIASLIVLFCIYFFYKKFTKKGKNEK